MAICSCPSCGVAQDVPAQLVGTNVACYSCHSVFVAPLLATQIQSVIPSEATRQRERRSRSKSPTTYYVIGVLAFLMMGGLTVLLIGLDRGGKQSGNIEVHGHGPGGKEFTIAEAGEYEVDVRLRSAKAVYIGLEEADAADGSGRSVRLGTPTNLEDGQQWITSVYLEPGKYKISPKNMWQNEYTWRIRVRRLPDRIID